MLKKKYQITAIKEIGFPNGLSRAEPDMDCCMCKFDYIECTGLACDDCVFNIDNYIEITKVMKGEQL